MKPILAISLGDPAGISPQIVLRSLDEALLWCHPVVFGHWPSLERVLEQVSLLCEINLVDEPGSLRDVGGVTVVNCGADGPPIEKPCERSASAQFVALERAVDAVIKGSCHALVTAPVSKKLVATVSPGFTGHTEYLARRARVKADDVTMVFASQDLIVGLVSTHLPLSEVSAAVTRPRLERTIRHMKQVLSRLRPGQRYRIGVAALNPHAGEMGLFGNEEEDVILPFCRDCKDRDDLEVVGPVPADVLFRDALGGKYDGVVSQYHDQAMIPLKITGVGRTVNMTMGLPFVRTSPDHGVAYDIARTNKANPAGMKLAIEFTARYLKSN